MFKLKKKKKTEKTFHVEFPGFFDRSRSRFRVFFVFLLFFCYYSSSLNFLCSSSLYNFSKTHLFLHSTAKQHVTITNGTVFNGTSTPIKDKYASEEKEFCDDMADYVAHKCQISDTMTKKSIDVGDDDDSKRQRIYEDANKLVAGKSNAFVHFIDFYYLFFSNQFPRGRKFLKIIDGLRGNALP